MLRIENVKTLISFFELKAPQDVAFFDKRKEKETLYKRGGKSLKSFSISRKWTLRPSKTFYLRDVLASLGRLHLHNESRAALWIWDPLHIKLSCAFYENSCPIRKMAEDAKTDSEKKEILKKGCFSKKCPIYRESKFFEFNY
jgi:hypothetical protein